MVAQYLIYGLLYFITVAAALGVLFNKDTVKSAMCLVMVMVSLAAHYFFLGQEFIGAIQIIVYAGAIMVLFLFVIMLLNVRERETLPWYLRTNRLLSGALAVVFFAVLSFGIYSFSSEGATPLQKGPAASIIDVSTLLTTKYALPFLLTSVLLLAAVIGAVVMGRRFDPETGEEYLPDNEAA